MAQSPKGARYGPLDRYEPPPAGGFCLSVFAVLRRGARTLVGQPEVADPRWAGDWIPQYKVYPPKDLEAAGSHWRLPSAYLREGEHPEMALERVLRGQLGIARHRAGPPRVLSYLTPSDWYQGQPHWDLAFVYRVQAALPAKPRPWWRGLAWKAPRDLAAADLGWNADLMRDLGLARAAAPPRPARAAPRRRG